MTQPTERPVSNLRLFGFPWWAVGLGIAGIIVIFIVIRNHFKNVQTASNQNALDANAANASLQAGAAISDQSQYGLPPGPIGSFLGSDPQNPAYPVGLNPQGIPGPVTNIQWARLVADQLIAKGDDPTLVTNALTKYLNGATLNNQEQAVINLALQTLGQPPEGVVPIQIVTGDGGSSGSSGGVGVPAPNGALFRSTGNRGMPVSTFASNIGVSLSTLLALNPFLKSTSYIPPHTTLRVQ